MADDTIKIAIEAVDNASATFEKVGDEIDRLGKAGEDAGAGAAKGAQGFESFAGKLVAVQAGVSIAQEAIQGLQKVWDFAKQGAENQRIAESFDRTAKSIGADADDIIAKLDEAARGTVDDEELMQASTRALTLGVAKSGDDLVNVMKLARGAALQFGGDAGQAFESINQAIGNLAPRALKQYGIIVNLKEANEAYAKAIGVSVDALTEEQQRQALLNAVLEQGAKNFGDIGNAATTTAEKMKAVETRLGNILDIAKETAATGLDTAFTIADSRKNALDAFTATAEKMRKEVLEGRMSIKDYNDGLRGMAQAILPLVGQEASLVFQQNKLTDEFADSTKGAYGFASALDESARAAKRSADAQAAEAARQSQAKDAAQKHTEVMRAYSAQLLANVAAYERTKINLADTTVLAIAYTEANEKQAEVQKKLDDLNQQIASHGVARSVTVRNEKLSTEELTRAQLQLKVTQEDLATVQRKSGESEAEFALRVDTIKGKIADYSQKLGEHTAIVGGATKAELEQKKALEEQIATLTKTEEIGRAKAAFESLTATFRSGALTEDQYRERAEALNKISGLYTESAFKQATAQEVLLKSFSDPRSETWRGQLLLNEKALDGQIDKTDKLAESNKQAVDSITKAGISTAKDVKIKVTPEFDFEALRKKKMEGIEIPVRPKLDTATNAKLAHDIASEAKFSPTITPRIDATQAQKDLVGFINDKLGLIPQQKKTQAILDTASATRAANDLLKLFGTLPATKKTAVDVDGKLALQTLDDIRLELDGLYSKTIEVKVKYKTEGEPPRGFQHGADFIVPPSPTGTTGDYYPFMAAAGERVTVTPAAQQKQAAPISGDTYNYTTNVYNPLAAAMLADKQRRDRLARSNSRMGVT